MPSVHIRPYIDTDASSLMAVFMSSVHMLAARDYTPAQLNAWAPPDLDAQHWQAHMQAIRPFIAEQSGHIVGYADLQDDGLIDHFFVAGPHAGQGVGTALMHHILQQARERGLHSVHAYVSLTAQAFFAKQGFRVVAPCRPIRLAVEIPNAHMQILI